MILKHHASITELKRVFMEVKEDFEPTEWDRRLSSYSPSGKAQLPHFNGEILVRMGLVSYIHACIHTTAYSYNVLNKELLKIAVALNQRTGAHQGAPISIIYSNLSLNQNSIHVQHYVVFFIRLLLLQQNYQWYI